MTLRVLDPGLYTLVVDFGRPHCRSLGVPVGGAADRTSLALGNALVGNPPDAAALEFALHGPTLEADCKLACVVYGAPFELTSSRQKLRVGKTFTLQPGERLEIGGTHEGMRAYLCIAGGIQGKMILGSRSSLEPVKTGEVLKCKAGETPGRFARIKWQWDPLLHEVERLDGSGNARGTVLRFLDGAQAAWFDPNWYRGEEERTPGGFRVTKASNRMGLRLDGRRLPIPGRNMVSEPVCPGTVQVTHDGQIIVLGVDGQTIGGYPKIAQVISVDLDKIAQLRPGDRVWFARLDLVEAERLYRARQAELRTWIWRMQATLAGGSSL